MRELNYNIQIIKEFKIGDDIAIPFLFSLDKIRAFNTQVPIISNECDGNYKSEMLTDEFADRLFQYVYREYIIVEYDKDFLANFRKDIDYEMVDSENFIIKSPRLFFEFLTGYCGYNPKIMLELKVFITSTEHRMINTFYKKIIEDLEYMQSDSINKNENIHMFQWALGHESLNNNPFFPENIGKATIDWSFREVELRNLYRSKEFKIENAIDKLKAKMMEDAKNKTNK